MSLRSAARRGLAPRLVAVLLAGMFLGGCGTSAHRSAAGAIPPTLLSEARPIGRGAAFHPPAAGPVVGRCADLLGPRIPAHVEVFAQDRVVIVAAGIGTRPPRSQVAGHPVQAACYGALVTLDPTGVVWIRPGARLSVRDLFRAWGQPLAPTRLASFTSPPRSPVAAFVDGRRWRGAPADIPLTGRAEIVLEIGPRIPPHPSYTFPPQP